MYKTYSHSQKLCTQLTNCKINECFLTFFACAWCHKLHSWHAQSFLGFGCCWRWSFLVSFLGKFLGTWRWSLLVLLVLLFATATSSRHFSPMFSPNRQFYSFKLFKNDKNLSSTSLLLVESLFSSDSASKSGRYLWIRCRRHRKPARHLKPLGWNGNHSVSMRFVLT